MAFHFHTESEFNTNTPNMIFFQSLIFLIKFNKNDQQNKFLIKKKKKKKGLVKPETCLVMKTNYHTRPQAMSITICFCDCSHISHGKQLQYILLISLQLTLVQNISFKILPTDDRSRSKFFIG